MASAGWVLTDGQPVTRTLPPLTTAAARNGTALDRSGSMVQCRAAIGPGCTRQRLACASSTSTPASRSIDTVIATCGAEGTDSPVCTMVSPSVNAAPDSISPDTNCDEAEASISTVPPATDPSPCTRNGRPSPSMATPSPRSAVSSGAMGRARACSSPSNVTVSVLSAATGGTNRSTVPASPQSTRAPGSGLMRPLIVSSLSAPSTVTPSACTAPIIRSVSRLRSAPLMVDVPCGGGQRGEHQRPVGLRLRARHGDRRVDGGRCRGCRPIAHAVHPALSVVSATMGHMCGRFAVTTDPALLAEKIQAIDEATSAQKDSGGPNYNVAPTTTISTVVKRHSEPDDESSRRVRLMRWGLIPPWVKTGPDGAPDGKGPLLINARADKVTSSPAFRNSAKNKRCLVPMDGWYEWRPNGETAAGKKAPKTPFYMYGGDGEMLFMAGLWSTWRPKDATEGRPAAAELHHHHHRRRRSTGGNP